MKKTLSLFAIGMLVLSACQSSDTGKIEIDLSTLLSSEINSCELSVASDLFEQRNIEDMHADQITGCFTAGNMTFAFVSQPNTWTPLTGVREWEKAGNTAWSGLLYSHDDSPFVVFMKIPNEDYNPVGLYLQEEALVLDTADDSGAGSGEGNLLRFVYPFAGVDEELLYQWTAEACTSYYNPDTYSVEHGSCDDSSLR